MRQYCENPYCPNSYYATSGCDTELDVCPECGYYSCGRCGGYFDPEQYCSDTCIYCGGTGRIDCTDRKRKLDYCTGCGDKCCRYLALEEEYERTLREYRSAENEERK